MNFILTEAQANELRGNYGKHSRLEPILIKSGEYILPFNILIDEDIPQNIKDYLSDLPKRVIDEDEFIREEL